MIKNRILGTEDIYFKSPLKTGINAVDSVKGIYRPVKHSPDAVILLHGYGMEKEIMEPFADIFINNAISTLQIDLPYHGERSLEGKGFKYNMPESISEIRKGFQQTLLDIEFSSKLLYQKGHDRVSVMGYSLGAIITLLALGKGLPLHKGFAAFGGGHIDELINKSPIAENLRRNLPENTSLEKISEELKEYEPVNYAHNIGEHKLTTLNGLLDDIVPPSHIERFVERMKFKPNINWVNSGHYDDFIEEVTDEFAKNLHSNQRYKLL